MEEKTITITLDTLAFEYAMVQDVWGREAAMALWSVICGLVGPERREMIDEIRTLARKHEKWLANKPQAD